MTEDWGNKELQVRGYFLYLLFMLSSRSGILTPVADTVRSSA